MGQEGRKATDLDKLVGARLRARRVVLGLRQDEIADRCGVSPQQYWKYENGISRITVARLISFSNALQTPLSWFVYGIEEDKEIAAHYAEIFCDADAIELMALFSRLENRRARKSILSFIRGMVSEQLTDVSDAPS